MEWSESGLGEKIYSKIEGLGIAQKMNDHAYLNDIIPTQFISLKMEFVWER